MATSGTYRLTTTLNDVIEEALEVLQIGADGETLSADMQKRSRKTMNFMLKAWEGQGIHLWCYEEGTLFLTVGQAEYDFNSAATHLANTWYETTLSAAEASGQTILSVTSTANMVATDPIGIILSDNTIHWSTIASTTATTVTINDPLTGAASSGASVRNYRVNSFIPVNRIMETRRRESSTYEILINFESRADYFNLPDKSSTGVPVQTYFSRQQPPGKMYVWPAPSSAVDAINFTYERPIQIMSTGTDNFDLPDYWFEALIYNLADRLVLKYGCSRDRAVLIKEKARESLDIALEYDTDIYPITVEMRRA